MITQEAFDMVWGWYVIHRQRRGWDIPLGRCVYRSPHGCRCPVGVLMADALYNPAMEGASVLQLLEFYPDVEQYFRGVDVGFLNDIQTAHDNSVSAAGGSDFTGYMQKKLTEIADKYRLVIPSTPIPPAPVVQGHKPQFKNWGR